MHNHDNMPTNRSPDNSEQLSHDLDMSDSHLPAIRPDGISPAGIDSLNQVQKVEALSPEAVIKLENLDLDIDPENDDFWRLGAPDKVGALLVAVGEKPAALTFSMGEPYDAGDALVEPRDSFVEYVNLLHELGLHTFVNLDSMEALPDPARPGVARRLAVRTVYMARTEQELHRLLDAKTLLATGQALGYPDTSVSAFDHGDKLPISLIADADPVLKAFNFFILSQDNYEAELAVAARWAEAVRQTSSTIYNAVTNKIP